MIGVIMTESQWIEQAARIIQPITFRSYDDLVAYCLRNGDGIETATRFADRTYGDDMVNARAKAAALYPLVQQAVAAERERCAKILKARASHLRTPEGCISAQWHSNDAFMVAGELERQAEAIRQMKDTNDDR